MNLEKLTEYLHAKSESVFSDAEIFFKGSMDYHSESNRLYKAEIYYLVLPGQKWITYVRTQEKSRMGQWMLPFAVEKEEIRTRLVKTESDIYFYKMDADKSLSEKKHTLPKASPRTSWGKPLREYLATRRRKKCSDWKNSQNSSLSSPRKECIPTSGT